MPKTESFWKTYYAKLNGAKVLHVTVVDGHSPHSDPQAVALEVEFATGEKRELILQSDPEGNGTGFLAGIEG